MSGHSTTPACWALALVALAAGLAHCQQPAGPQVRIGEDVFGLRVTEGAEQAPIEVTWETAGGQWQGTAEGI